MMPSNSGKLKLTSLSDREIQMTREFNAPRELVYDAFTKPELVRRWLSGPPGWSMTTCEMDVRVGGKYRWEWSGDQRKMGMGGVYREVVAPQRIVCTEKFDDAWYPGEAVGTVVLTQHAGKTMLTQTILYESRAARDAVLKTPMEQGVAMGYDKMEQLLAELARR